MRSAEDGGGQLQLLPARVPGARRATLPLADLVGYEHASPDVELVELIARLGLLQPIVVTGSPGTGYRVIEGRRRAKAIEQLADQGRWPVPARLDALIVRGLDGQAGVVAAGLTLALHASRSPSPASELAAIEAILAAGDEEACTVTQIAAQTRMAVQTVRRRLRLRDLTPELRAAFDRGQITAGVAEAAARLSAEQQTTLEHTLREAGRMTLADVRDVARRRAADAISGLPDTVFEERDAPWRLTVRGHLQAALDAVPATERDDPFPRAIAATIAHPDRPEDSALAERDEQLDAARSEAERYRSALCRIAGAESGPWGWIAHQALHPHTTARARRQ